MKILASVWVGNTYREKLVDVKPGPDSSFCSCCGATYKKKPLRSKKFNSDKGIVLYESDGITAEQAPGCVVEVVQTRNGPVTLILSPSSVPRKDT